MKVIVELRQEYSLDVLLNVSKIKRSTFYYHLNAKDKDMKNADLIEEIKEIFKTNKKRFGYRRVHLELKKRGHTINEKKVRRLMKVLNLKSKTPKVKYRSYKGDFNNKCSNYLLKTVVDEINHKTYYVRDFSTTSINEKWSTDVTEFSIPEGKLYLSAILDLHNREIVAYCVSKRPNFKQVTKMLDQAFEKYPNLEGLIFHSDQGRQYQMKSYQEELKKRGIIQSMSRKGNCLDNSPMENFFGIMKREMFYGYENTFKTLDDLEKAIIEYIDYYNNQRITLKTKGLTPVEYRQQSLNGLV